MRKGLSSSNLKLIAMGLMVLDHSYKIFYYSISDFLLQYTGLSKNLILWLMQLIGLFGALSFWMFAYFIAEGCRHTHDRKSYLIRLLLLGVISEIPFQYMICIISETPMQLHIGLTNVFFTLFLGGLAIQGYDILNQKKHNLLCYLPLLICMLGAYLLKTDYDTIGVAACFVCYAAKKEHRFYVLAALILIHAALMIDYNAVQEDIGYISLYFAYALLSIPLLRTYNGERGHIPKWLFYNFYPLHITVFVLLYTFML